MTPSCKVTCLRICIVATDLGLKKGLQLRGDGELLARSDAAQEELEPRLPPLDERCREAVVLDKRVD
eukprot:6194904-Pleurochrysis_carterae.AAC.3